MVRAVGAGGFLRLRREGLRRNAAEPPYHDGRRALQLLVHDERDGGRLLQPMSVKIIAFAAVLVVPIPALAASDSPQRVPQNPPPLPALTPIPASEAVVAAWGKAKHHFTPEVKAAYLAFAKGEALRDLAKARHSLPVDFTAWVDSDPAVAATVYGIQRGRPAQVLAALHRSNWTWVPRKSARNTRSSPWPSPWWMRPSWTWRRWPAPSAASALATNHTVPAQDSTEPPEKGEHPPD